MKKSLLLFASLSFSTQLFPEVTQTIQDLNPNDHSTIVIQATRALLDLSWKFKTPRKNQAEADQLLKQVEKLLAAGANPNACIETGVVFESFPPIWETESLVQRSIPHYPEILECLLKAGASVYSGGLRRDEGEAFFTAIAHNYVEIVEIFLKYGANANYKVPYRAKPLSLAIGSESKETAELLIKYGATE